MKRAVALALSLSIAAAPAAASCYEEAAATYAPYNADLLRAIEQVESGGNPDAVARNQNGSEDVCSMQINSQHMPFLKRFGITRSALLADHCLCVKVGAFFLATEVSNAGWSWKAVGQYNTGPAGSASRKETYARKVFDTYQRIVSERGLSATAPRAVTTAEMRQATVPSRSDP